jgi:hypothetical protein
VRIHPAADGGLFFLDANGRLVDTRAPYVLTERGVRLLLPAEGHRRFLALEPGRLGVLAPASQPQGPARLEWVAACRRLRDASWAHGASHALFVDDATLKLAECGAAGAPLVRTLAIVRRGTAAAYSEHTGRAYYLTPAGELASVEVAAQPELPLPFVGERAAAGRDAAP